MIYRISTLRSRLILLLMSFLFFRAEQWCLQTTLSLTMEATKMDYAPDNSLFAITSTPGNKVLIYEPFNYNLDFTYSPAATKTVQTARFSKNGIYLGVGLSDGSVDLIPGKFPFSSTANRSFTPAAGKTVSDIAFDVGNANLLVCYSNSGTFYVIHNYAGASTINSNSLTGTTGIKGCKFSQNNDVVIIDVTNKVYIFPSTLTPVTTSLTSSGGPYADVDVRYSTVTPIKVILGGTTDNKGFYLLNGASQVALTFIFTPTGPITAVCYSPDGLNFAMGNSADQYMWVFN